MCEHVYVFNFTLTIEFNDRIKEKCSVPLFTLVYKHTGLSDFFLFKLLKDWKLKSVYRKTIPIF